MSKPIIFSEPMVLRILDGEKTQTRRFINPQPDGEDRKSLAQYCPYGHAGDMLWVKEAWRSAKSLDYYCATEIANKCLAAGYEQPESPIWYESDGQFRAWGDASSDDFGKPGRYRHARFMPSWASRITLEITDVRVEALQEISEQDAQAEGIDVGVRALVPGQDIHSAPCIYCNKHRATHIGTAMACWGRSTIFDPKTYKGGFAFLWNQIYGENPDRSWSKNPWVRAISFRRVQ